MYPALVTRSFALALLWVAGGVIAADVAPPATPAVLRESAVISRKADAAASLAVARSGRRLVSAGERGIVLLSDNGGASWQQASVPVQASLAAVRFVDERTGWAAGHLGVILKTEDGGANWALQFDGVRAARLQAESLSAGGDERAKRAAKQLLAEGPDKPFFDLDFIDKQRGFAVGAYGMAFTTDDGGKTWTPMSARLPNPKGLHLYAVRVRGNSVFIAGEQGLMLQSTDGGINFHALSSPYNGSLFGLLLSRSGTLLAYGLRGNLYRSTDQGAHWTKVDTGVPASIGAGIELDDGRLVLLSQTGDTLVSSDDGASFKKRAAAVAIPAAGLAAAPNGGLVLATLRGMWRQPQP